MNAREEYEKDLEWLAKAIPPDDIYYFALQAYWASEFFLAQWSKHQDLVEAYENDKHSRIWLTNIISFRVLRENRETVNFSFEEVDEDYN